MLLPTKEKFVEWLPCQLDDIQRKSLIHLYFSYARDLLFADDDVLVAHSQAMLQDIFYRLNHACKDIALYINVQKTVILAQGNHPAKELITLDGKPLGVQKFCCLGSTNSSSFSLDEGYISWIPHNIY